jgi:hypothetical protein
MPPRRYCGSPAKAGLTPEVHPSCCWGDPEYPGSCSARQDRIGAADVFEHGTVRSESPDHPAGRCESPVPISSPRISNSPLSGLCCRYFYAVLGQGCAISSHVAVNKCNFKINEGIV